VSPNPPHLVALLFALAVVAPAAAERAPDDLCTAGLQRASGRLANCLLRADARFAVTEDAERHERQREKCQRAFRRGHERVLERFGTDACPNDSAEELGDAVRRSAADVNAVVADAGSGGGGFTRLGPMTAAVKGVNYEPAPSNYSLPPAPLYYDTDFYNQDFVQLWGPGTPPTQPNGRNDVADMLSLGINFIRVFNWNPGGAPSQPLRNHQPFLDYLVGDGGKRIFVGAAFANGNRGTAAAQMEVDQFNGFSAAAKQQVAVWLVGNEISPTDPFTPQTLQVIKARAQPPLDTIPICVPFQMSSLSDALSKVQQSHQQFMQAGVHDRFIACFNFYGLGQPAATKAPAVQLREFIDGFFTDSFVTANNISLLLTEFGINFDGTSGVEPNAGGDAAKQGQYLGAMLAESKTLQTTYPRFLGQVIFEYTNEGWKTPTTEANFGLYALTPQVTPFTGKTTNPSAPAYPVDTRVPRPQHQAVVDNY